MSVKTFSRFLQVSLAVLLSFQALPSMATAEDPENGDDLEALRALAEAEAEEEQEKPAGEESLPVFRALGLSLQGLNPEISVVGDMLGSFRRQEGVREQWKFNFRSIGLHFQAYVDPYTKFFAAFPVTPGGVPGIGEVFVTRHSVLPNVNLTAGKFRQHFGFVNRWHKPALDQSDFPLALRQLFGPGGLNQTGLSLYWRMPSLWASSQEFTLELTNGENPMVFSGNTLSNPSMLGRLLSYWDLSKDTYFEIGLTGLVGFTDQWTVDHGTGPVTEFESHWAGVFGIDLSLLWEPTDAMRYTNVEWRAEGYFLHKEILPPDGSDPDPISAWGAYSYLQAKISRTMVVGFRADYWQPDGKAYATHANFEFGHLVATHDSAWRGQASAYVTWNQSPFLRLRLEYQRLQGHRTGDPEDWVVLQLTFSAGPHLHERY